MVDTIATVDATSISDEAFVDIGVTDRRQTIRQLDRFFGEWIANQFASGLPQVNREKLTRIAQAVSYAVNLKHTCVELGVYPGLSEPVLDSLLDGITAADVKKLLGVEIAPLVASADGARIWLQKYHAFEMAVAQQLQRLRSENRLEIITGGPGTGKTWTAAQRIEQALAANPECTIALAAPTGKAANNMMTALARSYVDTSRYNLKGLTLHSLLGMNGRSPKPRRDQNYLLSCELLIVDEASMIDLPMMYRLLQAIPPNATLLLLGDKDQLASVEAGSVLAEICAVFANQCVTTLGDSRRYKDSPEIGVLAVALNAGTVPDMSANTRVISHTIMSENQWQPAWLDQAKAGYAWISSALKANMDAATALQQQTRFQLLCALREGPQGVVGINAMMEKSFGYKPDSWYAGRPVMVTQNDHSRKLYNGDVGLVWPVQQGGDTVLKACFLVDGHVKAISQAQMPAYDTCYAITVHKSQGSEYDQVMIVLPADQQAAINNPVLTRELVYTAVTRAKDKVDLWAGEGVLAAAAQKSTQRMSGLASCLSQIV